jgi:glyoxylase-like metal-dependent hydrolase (beta-lactamase superfamily II)
VRIHHLNCGSLCPVGGRLVDGRSAGLRARLVCHVLLIEAPTGLVLVDSGLGTRAVADAAGWLGRGPVAMLAPRLDASETAAAHVRRLGFSVDDVRDIVITHLDLDHAGGIADFPQARIHVHRRELEVALGARGLATAGRYRAVQWRHAPRWVAHEVTTGPESRWNGLEAIRAIDEKSADILLVPLFGHSRGHAGIAVRRDDGSWLLHAGDAYFHEDEMRPRPSCPPLLSALERLDDDDHAARVANQARLRALATSQVATVFCSHDAAELARLQADAVNSARLRYAATP